MTLSFFNVELIRGRLDRHPCLRADLNPVLASASRPECGAPRVAAALGQYAFLPRRIAELLTLGANRTGSAWPRVTEELRRNVGEELGDKTSGLPHFQILKCCLREEVGLDLERVRQGSASATFLDALAARLTEGTRPQAAGVVTALEDSATPELHIVARLIDRYAELEGRERPIDLELLKSEEHLEEIWPRIRTGLSLEDFFALHVLYFEAGHSEGLATAIAPYLTSRATAHEFVDSYDSTLESMDRWWEGMAEEVGLVAAARKRT